MTGKSGEVFKMFYRSPTLLSQEMVGVSKQFLRVTMTSGGPHEGRHLVGVLLSPGKNVGPPKGLLSQGQHD